MDWFWIKEYLARERAAELKKWEKMKGSPIASLVAEGHVVPGSVSGNTFFAKDCNASIRFRDDDRPQLIPPCEAGTLGEALLAFKERRELVEIIASAEDNVFKLSRRGHCVNDGDALLCPGHVSTIIGADAYGFIPRDHALPCAIAGFTPLDILLGVNSLVNQTVAGEPQVDNCYPRAVQAEGNPKARAQVESVFSVADAHWRGLGMLPASGLALRTEYSHIDARTRFDLDPPIEIDRGPCICGEVLQGKALPTDCPAFGSACTPQSPIGPCMVSSEGSCAAAYRYGG